MRATHREPVHVPGSRFRLGTSQENISRTVAYVYDERGQRVAQNRSLNLAGLNINAASTYSYDSAGRITKQGYPDNVAVSYARNNAGQVNAVTLTLNGQSFPIASNIAYAPFGPLKQLTWGNGLTLSRTYDQDYQLTAQTVGNWQNQYGFDPAGNITSQQSNLWGAVQYQYDALNRLTREQSATTQKDYTLDATGNRTERKTTDLASGTVTETQTATVAADSNRLETLDGLTLPYDASGNLQQHTTGLRYTYDDSGRMNAVYQAGAQRVATFTYNSLGQRTLKLTFDPVSGALVSGSTYLYGAGGEVIGQADYGPNGQRLVTRYWIWLDGMPLAQVELNYTQGGPSGFQLVYLHSDHLNTPRLASTHQGIVWSWISDAYGAALPNEDVSGTGTTTHIPLRFPGQLYDAQTQLSYNYYRDYDANLGRYVQSDPIGLNGGLNTYGYVNGNPLNRLDPYGLNSIGSINVYVPGSGGSLAAGTGVFGGVGAGVAIGNWLSQPMFAKPKPGSKPKGCPSGTIPIDQVPGLDKDDLHGVKEGVNAGPRDWTGVAPNGDVYTGDADGNAVNNGPITDYLP